jgi:hypothetical protein
LGHQDHLQISSKEVGIGSRVEDLEAHSLMSAATSQTDTLKAQERWNIIGREIDKHRDARNRHKHGSQPAKCVLKARGVRVLHLLYCLTAQFQKKAKPCQSLDSRSADFLFEVRVQKNFEFQHDLNTSKIIQLIFPKESTLTHDLTFGNSIMLRKS